MVGEVQRLTQVHFNRESGIELPESQFHFSKVIRFQSQKAEKSLFPKTEVFNFQKQTEKVKSLRIKFGGWKYFIHFFIPK